MNMQVSMQLRIRYGVRVLSSNFEHPDLFCCTSKIEGCEKTLNQMQCGVWIAREFFDVADKIIKVMLSGKTGGHSVASGYGALRTWIWTKL